VSLLLLLTWRLELHVRPPPPTFNRSLLPSPSNECAYFRSSSSSAIVRPTSKGRRPGSVDREKQV